MYVMEPAAKLKEAMRHVNGRSRFRLEASTVRIDSIERRVYID